MGKAFGYPCMLATIGAFGAVVGCLLVVPASIEAPATDSNILFFDGVCNLCDGFVGFVADHDPDRRVTFGAIQRHGDLMKFHGAGAYAEGGAEALSTLVLVSGGRVHVRSDAALRVAALLDGPARYLAAFHVLPAPVRDAGYRLVAKYRYAIFGEAETCREPTPKFKSRFLDYEPDAADDGPGWAH